MRWTTSASAQPLKELMEGRDFAHVARKVKVKPEILARWIAGKERPPLAFHMTLAKVLGVPGDCILYAAPPTLRSPL